MLARDQNHLALVGLHSHLRVDCGLVVIETLVQVRHDPLKGNGQLVKIDDVGAGMHDQGLAIVQGVLSCDTPHHEVLSLLASVHAFNRLRRHVNHLYHSNHWLDHLEALPNACVETVEELAHVQVHADHGDEGAKGHGALLPAQHLPSGKSDKNTDHHRGHGGHQLLIPKNEGRQSSRGRPLIRQELLELVHNHRALVVVVDEFHVVGQMD
mmetsp:Transcript_19514/g.52038  ORF Transcript_19514/g.52038 Transcript_19514/m.52038 type:complete len:211 (+) Transcript_19514:848-1480(+)